ncbi:hypothetical protein M404DRAFT_994506 [Pisolithus tinctorius Marx 270]|uniref:Uncharacterized protein n=1 Tax=Pisolithus tinctorius Marx 270 TaxID=870435 RepID=A0A0C3PDK1_PISTI|nr:hypothetical protein M404DRAFT_994506 [Pisolithus tinctorius Marx 270]
MTALVAYSDLIYQSLHTESLPHYDLHCLSPGFRTPERSVWQWSLRPSISTPLVDKDATSVHRVASGLVDEEERQIYLRRGVSKSCSFPLLEAVFLPRSSEALMRKIERKITALAAIGLLALDRSSVNQANTSIFLKGFKPTTDGMISTTSR